MGRAAQLTCHLAVEQLGNGIRLRQNGYGASVHVEAAEVEHARFRPATAAVANAAYAYAWAYAYVVNPGAPWG